MTSKTDSPVDLSDLDPFHAPSRTASPRIFQSTPAPSSTSSNATAPRPPPPLPSKVVKEGDDPLDSFASLIDLKGEEGGGMGASTSGLRKVVRAQDERQEQVWSDLSRDPWEAPSDVSAAVRPPNSSGADSTTPLPLRRKPSRRESSSASFSPPRRLSGLMESHIYTASSSPPPSQSVYTTTTSRPSLDPFHPSSPPPHSAQETFRRIRRASMDRLPAMSRTTEPSTSPDWGDFHSAFSPPLPTKTGSVSNQADEKPLPSTTSRAGANGRSSSPEPSPSVSSHRPPPPPTAAARSSTVPLTKKEWQYDPRSPDAVQPIVLRGLRPGVQRALDEDMAEGIRPSLPPRLRISTKWNLLYSLDQHGISIGTMYDRMKVGLRGVDGGVVLVVKDGKGSVFGAYVNEGLKESSSYYGDGTCFLWKSTPFSPSDFRVGSSVKAFKWTGCNDYLVLTEHSYISVGGGDGKFGLWIDGVFEKGFTTSCPCFDNEPLAAKEDWEKGPGGVDQAKFDVMQFECWSVDG